MKLFSTQNQNGMDDAHFCTRTRTNFWLSRDTDGPESPEGRTGQDTLQNGESPFTSPSLSQSEPEKNFSDPYKEFVC
jgi:hypothetical protein